MRSHSKRNNDSASQKADGSQSANESDFKGHIRGKYNSPSFSNEKIWMLKPLKDLFLVLY